VQQMHDSQGGRETLAEDVGKQGSRKKRASIKGKKNKMLRRAIYSWVEPEKETSNSGAERRRFHSRKNPPRIGQSGLYTQT